MGRHYSCFKAYDVRGKVPEDLNLDLAYKIGRAFAEEIKPKTVCIGYDARLSGPGLADSLTRALTESGVDVVDAGMVGTEMIYYAVGQFGFDGGIMITASHNPPEYNGFKMVRQGSRPISSDSGLNEIEDRTHSGDFTLSGSGRRTSSDLMEGYIDHLMQFIDIDEAKPLRILADAGNGAAGPAIEALSKRLPVSIDVIRSEPDGHFPTGVPNPILEESRTEITNALRAAAEAGNPYDFGVAWDGDYDRCFFLTGDGEFIEGYYIVGLLAQAYLAKSPGASIIYDPRLTWCTEKILEEAGGCGVMSRSGHAFIKERMRKEDAVYGGEMSAHHYFKDNWYCDSGMIPLLLIIGLLSSQDDGLDQLVRKMIDDFPCSGEINRRVSDAASVIQVCRDRYSDGKIETIDGLSVAYPDWRFNLRASNTEPLLRLNVESLGDRQLMEQKTSEILALIEAEG